MDHCHVPVLFAGFHSLYKEYGTRIIKRKEKRKVFDWRIRKVERKTQDLMFTFYNVLRIELFLIN
jgi:ABC-type phosphate/phosphonate transport system ATPase subunit